MAVARVLCPTLVGRDADLSVLEDALLSALRGDGGVVIVGGEAGMGKTRLVNALAMRARRLGCVVISGACSEAELSLPYLPFLEAIGNYFETADLPAIRERLGPAAEELAQLFPQMGRPTPTAGDAGQAKLRLFESILLLLRDAARSRALMLILEDLHWADPATRELLDYATRRLRSTNVLVVATYRTDELHRKHALLPTIQGWRRAGHVELVELEALDAPRVADMVCAIFDEESVTDEFRDFLHDRSEGNPFVLEEMLRDALDRGDIFHNEKGWDRKSIVEIRIPRTVKDTLLQRLERLAHEHVAVLSAASVIGRSFDLKTLAAVAGVDEAGVLAALEASVTAQLLEEEDRTSGRYRFRHALTREAVYEDLVVPRRQQLHSRVADVLAARSDRAAVDLANHLLMAGRHNEAVAMCVAAAEDAIRAYAYRDAGELLERAAPYGSDPIDRARMLGRAGYCYWLNAETANARRILEPAIADLESAGLKIEAAGQRLILGRCYWELMKPDLAREQFERARDVLEPAGPSEDLAIAYIRLSGLATFDNQHDLALEQAKRGQEIAQLAGAGLPLAWSWNFMALAEIGLGEVNQGFAHLEQSYQTSITKNYRLQASNAVYNAVWLAVHLARGDQLSKWAERISVFGESYGVTHYARASVLLYQGRVADAIKPARHALQRSRDEGYEKMVWRSAVLLAHALAENLTVDEAVALMPPVTTRVEMQDAIYDGAARILVRLAAGDAAAAFADAKSVPFSACHHGSPLDAIAEAADDPAWLRTYIEAVPILGEVLGSPRVAAARGRLALLEGDTKEAIELLTKAEADLRAGGLWLDAWHTGRALAEAEFRAGRVDTARERLSAIVAQAEPKGALLAARLARQTATKAGLDIGAEPEKVIEPPGTPRVATGERLVSVLFADVRGYTEITGQTAPSDLADRIATLQRWATQEVGRRLGMVDKFAGDAIMATFNVSGQSVDHALQALRAAIAIIDKAALAGLPVGAGIAVGAAVVGNLAESANLSVLGDVTNLAARLQATSGPGEVTLSEEAYRRVSDWLGVQGIPSERVQLNLKGFSEPVPAYRVTATTVAASPA
jgi:class 3 adenylate cyclase